MPRPRRPLVLLTILAFAALGFGALPKPEAGTDPIRVGAPYLLKVCAVSGRPLPADGGQVLVFDGGGDALQAGREFRFCCGGCKTRFLADPKKYIEKVDELVIADQLPRYPATARCLVMTNEVLPDPKGPDAKDCKLVVVRNRLVRLCCAKCVRMFKSDPKKYIEALDKVVIAEAKEAGEIKTCAVNGRALRPSAVWFVVGDRPVATCCPNCRRKVNADPRKFVLVDAEPKKEA